MADRIDTAMQAGLTQDTAPCLARDLPPSLLQHTRRAMQVQLLPPHAGGH